MSIYSKEEFIGPSGDMVGAPINQAQVISPVAEQSTETPCYISSAVAVTIIQGYVAFRAKNNSLTNVNDALSFISTFTKDLVDNGELTLTQIEFIKDWTKQHANMFMNTECCCKHKLIHKVLSNCGLTCNGSANCAPDSSISEYFRAHDALHRAERKVMDEIGTSINTAIKQFIARYGKLMDESYIKSWEL